MKITDYKQITELPSDSIFLLNTDNGTKTITARELARRLPSLLEGVEAFENLEIGSLPSTADLEVYDKLLVEAAGGVNKAYVVSPQTLYTVSDLITGWSGLKASLVRGKNLGTSVSDEQYEEIRNGTFRDMFLGDYWDIGGRWWVIVDFDYWYRATNNDVKDHHIVIMPLTGLYSTQWNTERSTDGGYVGSAIRTAGLENAKSIIISAFGDSHLLRKNELLINAVTNGVGTGNVLVKDSFVELPNEAMIFGFLTYGARRQNSNPDTYEMYGLSYFKAAKSAKYVAARDYAYWLRDISGMHQAVIAQGWGSSFGNIVNNYGYVRPVFAIKG